MIRSFGQLPSGLRLSRIKSSSNYREGAFQNVYPTPMLAEGASYPKMMHQFFFGKQDGREPMQPLATVKADLKNIRRDEPSITWFGHSSYMLTLGGKIILVDPVFSQWASPFQFMGSKAFPFQNNYTLDQFPDPDLVIITHDHYDHLDHASIQYLASRAGLFATSLGVGAHLEFWGVDPSLIQEFDWWESREVLPGLELAAMPSRHFSGRGFKRNQSLWSAFLLKVDGLKLLVGGDSGYDETFKKIGEKTGGVDFAILECGQYDAMWPNIHMMPEETVQAGVDLLAKAMMAVHWGKFKLANHLWMDPIERAYAKAKELNVSLATPRIGERMLLSEPVLTKPWWKS